jgi:hypothetical protein
MKITVTKQDLHRALAVPWSTNSCLIAQAGYRQGFRYAGSGKPGGQFINIEKIVPEIDCLMSMFDGFHPYTSDNDPMMLAMLEAVLPMEIEVP